MRNLILKILDSEGTENDQAHREINTEFTDNTEARKKNKLSFHQRYINQKNKVPHFVMRHRIF